MPRETSVAARMGVCQYRQEWLKGALIGPIMLQRIDDALNAEGINDASASFFCLAMWTFCAAYDRQMVCCKGSRCTGQVKTLSSCFMDFSFHVAIHLDGT
mmetsp:Transcript_98508/g.169723  ORF Transcript_98508/g.169723 Transcript_98508/m.169723 type:complete len:100 (-) Transcript_98508:674-973(-)